MRLTMAAVAICGFSIADLALGQEGGKIPWQSLPADTNLSQPIQQAGKPAMVYFRAGWSEGCRQLDERAFSDGDVVRLSRAYTCILIDISEYKTQQIAKALHGIAGLPTVRFYNNRGERVDEVVASSDPELYRRKLRGEGRAWKSGPVDLDPSKWIDTHRVYLHNGSALDGRLKEVNDEVVILQWDPTTEVRFQRIEVDRIEWITIRRLDDAPRKLDLPKGETPPTETPTGGKPAETPPSEAPPAADTKPEVKAQVDRLIARLKTDEDRDAVARDLSKAGTPALVYAATRVGSLDANTALYVLGAITMAREKRAAASLRPHLRSVKDGEVLVTVVNALVSLQDPGAAKEIRKLHTHENVAVRASVAEALGFLGERAHFPDLAAATVDPVKEVRSKGCASLVQLAKRLKAESNAFSALRSAISNAPEARRDYAALALGQLAEPAAASILIGWLRSRSEDVRANSVVALGELKVADAAGPLADLLEGEDQPRVLQLLCGALSKLRAREAVPALIRLMERESNREVRTAAGRALQDITRQKFGPDPDQWKKWYEATRGGG